MYWSLNYLQHVISKYVSISVFTVIGVSISTATFSVGLKIAR